MESNPSYTPESEEGHYSGFTVRLFLRIRWCLWSFTLLEPSPSSDEDANEWLGQSSTHTFTVGLVYDCPTVTVHAGKQFKALISSGATISLMHPSMYNMIEDCYKTSILPTVIHLRTADGSPMSSVRKVTLHLWIANFKFSHTSIICNRLPKTAFLFGINLQKWNFLSYCWDSDRHLFIQREGPNSWPTPETGMACLILQ